MHRLIALVLALIVLSFAFGAHAQDEEEVATDEWNLEGLVGLNIAQSTFSDNWSSGANGSINWILNSDFTARRLMRGFIDWKTQLQLAYGQTNRQEETDSGSKEWTRPDKTTDLIQLESTALFDTHHFVEPYFSFRFDSFFLDDSNPLGRLILNPLKFSETAGIARVLDKTEKREWIGRFGFGFRQTFRQSFTTLDTDATEGSAAYDGGFELQTTATYPLWSDNITYKGKLLFFWPLYYSQKEAINDFDNAAIVVDPNREKVGDFWKAPDVNWQNTITAQITSVIAVNLYVQLVYDKFDQSTNVDTTLPIDVLIANVDAGVRKAGQFQQTLALGLTYTFF